LGAALRADFSASELRSAFRLLARNYHPDRHPGASEPTRQRLSQQFTTIRSNYETLLTALDSATDDHPNSAAQG
jgi:DnaJ-class molecular chaperone